MRFVQRDDRGEITGDYAVPQPGIAEEEIDENAPEMVARSDRLAQRSTDPVAEFLDDLRRNPAKLARIRNAAQGV